MIIKRCFPGGRNHVLTLSYDDGAVADRRLVALLDRYGIRGTFCLNAGRLGQAGYITPEEVPELYRNQEVAGHTVHHVDLTTLPRAQQRAEIWEDRQALEEITGGPVQGFSYPYGAESAETREVLRACGIRYARTVASTGGFDPPEDWLRWHPTCRHRAGLLGRTAEFLRRAEEEERLLFFVWGHSYEFDRDGTWGLMETFCERIAHRPDTWYATNGAVAAYLQAEEGLRMDRTGVVNPAPTPVWLWADGRLIQVDGESSLTWSAVLIGE